MRVLFVGNSHTFCNALPWQVAALAASIGAPIDVTMLTVGGMSLEWHRGQPMTLDALRFGGFDAVSFQQVSHPFPGTAALLRDLEPLADLARAGGARPLLYEVWPEQDHPENATPMNQAYAAAEESLGIDGVPAARAWSRALEREPALPLYDPSDRRHAAPLGSYAAACCFVKVLLERDPRGLPARLAWRGTALVDLDPAQAAVVQAAAMASAV